MSEAFWTGVIHDVLVAIVPTLAGIAGIIAAMRAHGKYAERERYQEGAEDGRAQQQRKTDHGK